MEDSQTLSSRLDELETRSIYQEQTIQTLSEEVYHLRTLIDRLEKQNRSLSDRLKEVVEGPTGAFPADQKPPHY